MPRGAASFTQVVGSLSDPAVDGTFTDDVGGLPEEHGLATKRINMNTEQLAVSENLPVSHFPW
jgi:hypothetical protein